MDEALQPSERPPALVSELAASEQRLGCVIELSSNYYWEQDTQHRFTLIRHHDMSSADNAPWRFLGKTHWELGAEPLDGAGAWEVHKRQRACEEPFTDFIVRETTLAGTTRYLCISGQPTYDSSGRFKGYRGITRDVTIEQQRARLLRLERAVTHILVDARDNITAISATIHAICESEEWDAGQYWHKEADNSALTFFAGWNAPDPRTATVSRQARNIFFSRGAGLVGVVWATGEPLWVPDMAAEGARLLRKDIIEQSGWKAAMLFPVMSGSEVIGVLDFNSHHIQTQPDERLLQVITVFATQIGNLHQRSIALERLRESEQRYSDTVELAAIGISHVDQRGRFIHANRRVCEILGYTRGELLTLTVGSITHPDDVGLTDTERQRLKLGEIDSFKAEKRYLRKDGTPIWVGLTIAAKRNLDGSLLYEIAVLEDISERKRAEEKVQYLAAHDELTGLPNRTTFRQHLNAALAAAPASGARPAVMFIDLDHFKNINDSLGHEAGDFLLKDLAPRLRRCLSPTDVLSRFGGDEFVALIQNDDPQRPIATIARNMLAEATRQTEIMEHPCQISASIGVALYPVDGTDASALLKSADVAMYSAKEAGKNTVEFFSAQAGYIPIQHTHMETALRAALSQGEFHLAYQPRVRATSAQVAGAEALLRWSNPDFGTLEPSRFLAMIEQTGAIVPIGRWVLGEACLEAAHWHRAGHAVPVAVNVSPRQLRDATFLNDLETILADTGVPPRLLELELAEHTVMRHIDDTRRVLGEAKRLGVRLVLDDFGSGHTCLADLKGLPFDAFKLAQVLTRDITTDAANAAMTRGIVQMSHALKATAIATGVETSVQWAALMHAGCDEVQGFHIANPCPADQLVDLVIRGIAASPPK